MKSTILSPPLLLCFIELLTAGGPVQVEIPASRDAGFFNQDVNQNLGNHTHVPVGQTNDGRLNRSVFDFDISGSIPTGSTINNATFEFTVTNQGGDDGDEQAPADFVLHRVLTPWAEGSGSGNQGQQTGDGVTWVVANPLNGISWNTTGGDFDNTSLGSVFVNNEAIYQISSSQLTAAIQSFVDGEIENYGFLLKGDTNVLGSAARVSSRESGNPATLIVDFTPPVDILLGRCEFRWFSRFVGRRSLRRLTDNWWLPT